MPNKFFNLFNPKPKSNLQFDPLHDYGYEDMENPNNLVLWKFGELIKTLHTLASEAKGKPRLLAQEL